MPHARRTASRGRGPAGDLQSDREPPAQRRYRLRRFRPLGLGRGRRLRPRRRVSAPDRPGGDRRRLIEPGAPPRARTRHRPCLRPPLCAGDRRHRLCDLVPADPRSRPRRPQFRRAQPRRGPRLPHPPRLGQPRGFRPHRRRLEDHKPHPPPPRRHAGRARDPEKARWPADFPDWRTGPTRVSAMRRRV